MERYIDFVLRRPILTLVALVLITAALAPGMLKLEFDNAIEAFMPKSDYEYFYYNKIKDIYGDNGRFVIMAVSDDDLWSPETFQKIDNFLVDFEEYKDFDEEREESRLRKFDSIMSRGEVRYNNLIGHFHNDKVFQRQLKRKIKNTFGKISILDRGDLKKLRKKILLSTEFKRREVIDTILSPLTAQDITGENDTLETYDLIGNDDNGKRILPSTAKEMDKFRKKLRRNPAFERGIYALNPDTGEITDFCVLIKFINLTDQDPVAREVTEIINSHSELDIKTTGIPIVNIAFHNYMHRDLRTLVPIVMLVVTIVFYFNFRSFRGVLLPFITLSMAELWILGLMGYLGYKITAVGMSLPPLMIAVGSSYSIHILNQYYADFQTITKMDKRSGLSKSMSHISLTVLLAGLTTFIAFMTLTTSQVSAVRGWGFFSAIGIMFAVFISCSMIPAVLVLLPNKTPSLLLRKDKTVGVTVVDRIITLMTKGAVIHYKKVLAVVGILIVFSIIGLFHLRVETVFLNYLKEDDPVRKNVHTVGDKFGGAEAFIILIDSGKIDGIKDPEFLTMIENMRKWLVSEENPDLNIGRTDSFPDFIKTMHMAMNNDDISFYKIPENRMDIVDYLEIYAGDDDDSDGRFDEFEPFADIDFKTCNILARLHAEEGKRVGTTETRNTLNKISDYLDRNLPDQYSYSITGFPKMEIKLVY
ncbi:MAG: MMPL family transporter, partial [Thermodesulfobacteriota bacterium]|nr:MMPL family transporter [Thermodesulfobacteriota bacterium]